MKNFFSFILCSCFSISSTLQFITSKSATFLFSKGNNHKNTLYSSFKPMDHDNYLHYNHLFSDKNNTDDNNKFSFNISSSTNYTIQNDYQKNSNNFLSTVYNNSKLVPGLYVGMPIVILTAFFTYHHYGYNIMNFKITLIEFLLGFYTYGSDKLNDALQYKKQPYNTTNDDLYKHLIKNEYVFKELFKSIYYIITVTLFDLNANVFDSIACIILYDTTKWFIKFREYIKTPYIAAGSVLLIGMNELHILQFLPFVILIDYTNNYIQLKKNFGLLKPFYVSLMWAISLVVLPSVIHDNDFSILNSPLDILSPFSLIFALSNFVDIKDIDEDTKNGIVTIPAKYGKNTALLVSLLFMAIHISIMVQ